MRRKLSTYGSLFYQVFYLLVYFGIIAWVGVIKSCDLFQSEKHSTKQKLKWLKTAEALVTNRPDSSLIYLDSAIRIGRDERLDSLWLRILYDRALALFYDGSRDSCLLLLPALRSECIISKDTLHWSMVEHLASITYMHFGQTNFGLKHAEMAYELARSIKEPLHQALALVGMADAYSEKNELLKSQIQLQKAYQIYLGLDTAALLADVVSSLSWNFKQMGFFDSALVYGMLGVKYAERCSNSKFINVPYNNMGMLLKESDPERSLYWLRRALVNNPEELAPRFNIANVYANMGYLDEAIELLDSVLRDCMKLGLGQGVARCQWLMAEIFAEKREMARAEIGFRRAVEISDSLGVAYVGIGARNSLINFYRKQGELQQELAISKELSEATDSLHRKEKALAMSMAHHYQEAEELRLSLSKLETDSSRKELTNGQVIFLLLLLLLLLTIVILVIRRKYARNLEYQRKLLENYEQLVIQRQSDSVEKSPTLFAKLVKYMEEEKPWLNPQLKVDDILNTLECNRSAMTEAIRNENVPNLTHLVQQYRIKEAMRLMQDERFRNYKIDAIAKESGFGTYRNFHLVFVQKTGQTPLEYRMKLGVQ